MFDKDGKVFVTGTNFGHFNERGQLTHATGFFEAPKSSEVAQLSSADLNTDYSLSPLGKTNLDELAHQK